MEYHGKVGHTIGLIQNFYIMSRFYICYTASHLVIQTVAPTLPGVQYIKRFVQYLASHPHKTILYLYNYYYDSNFIRLTWSGNQGEDCKTQKCLELHKYRDTSIILTYYGQFQALFILFLGLQSSVEYKFNKL